MNKINWKSIANYPDLKGAHIFITGGATGIGASLVAAFAHQGARIAFVDIQEKEGVALAEALEKETGAVISFTKVDVTDTAALRQSIEEAMGKFGTIHALINNVANDKRTDIDELQEEEWHKSIDINLHPAFFAAQTAFPAMKKAGRGTIINFGSINSIIAPPNMVHYVTAKAGIEGMSKALAREYGPFGIRVNALLPGAIITEKQKELWYTSEAEKEWKKMVSIKETIYPVDVARLTLFLASDESTVITGQSIAICAGRT